MRQGTRSDLCIRAKASCLIIVVTLMTACGASTHRAAQAATTPIATATSSVPPPPTALAVLRFGGVANSNVAPFQMSTQDAAKVQQLYKEALNSPPYPNYAGCPVELGIGYELSFTSGSTLVQQVMLTGGCPAVKLSNPAGCRAWTPTLTQQIADTLGVPATTIEPPNGLRDTAGPNGPFAPGEPTPPILTPKYC